ncbi:MAG: cytochrome C [Methylococcaceae bacterium]
MIQRQAPPKLKGLASIVGSGLLGLMLLQTPAFAQTGLTPTVKNAYDVPVLHPAIPLLDEQGNSVLQSGNPYSPKKSCEGGGCHDYEKITHAFHFEMGRDEADDNYGKKRGIPHLVTPGYFGGYNCMGGNTPTMLSKKNNKSANEFMDYGSVDLIKGCSSCHMGGGYDEKDRDGIRYDQKAEADIKPFDGDYFTNVTANPSAAGDHGGHGGGAAMPGQYDTVIKRFDWKKSGVMEADCMTCHTAFSSLKKFPFSGIGKADLSDKSKDALTHWGYLRDTYLVKGDFFREVPTALLEFVDLKPSDPNGLQLVSFAKQNFKPTGTVTNGVASTKDTYELVLGANGKPKITWNPAAFDATGKVVIPMMRFTPPENCMNCHLTANSRRGFYGFGNEARMEQDEANGGTFKNDYKDDVHKGTTYTEINGETRAIENCNSCHAKNYYNPPFKSPELSLDHNFLKGNSDMDLRNDLDYAPNAKSCQYCHQDVPNPVIPSGHKTLLSAHESLWKNNGDMVGYAQETLTKVAKTHLDVITCEACHITGLQSGTTKLQVMYRYKKQEDGVSKIAPYNPSFRYTWRDRNSDKVIAPYELKMVYKDVPAATGSPVTQGQIINAMDGSVLATIGKTGAAYNFPKTYEQFVALKTAYDKLMEKRGFTGTNMQLVWHETNMYTMNHGTKQASQAVPCEQCHERKQNGSWSSLVSPKGIFGEANSKVVGLIVPDPRLITEGHIRFDQPYAKLNAKNQITINTADILYATKIDPFLTVAKNSSATTITGELKTKSLSSVMGDIGMVNDPYRKALDALYGNKQVFYFKNSGGVEPLQDIAVIGLSGGIADVVLPQYRFTMDLFANLPQNVVSMLEGKVPGSKLSSDAFLFSAKDHDNKAVKQFFAPVYVKLPYNGKATDASGIKVLSSPDGSVINQLDAKAIIDVKPSSDNQVGSSLFNFANVKELQTPGYIIFEASQFGWFAIVDVKK